MIANQYQFPVSSKRLFILLLSLTFLVSCKDAKKEEVDEVIEVEIEEITEEDNYENDAVAVLVIDEHQVNDLSITSAASNKNQTSTEIKPDSDRAAETQENKEDIKEDIIEVEEIEVDYEVYSVEALHSGFSELYYEPLEVTEAVIPLGETQTVVGYNKKGKEKDSFQVISEADGTIDQIIFTHKKHRDVYDVQAGMTAKEVKKLRKELKHMVKKDKVFLYSDTSNIMYLLDVQDMEGDELVEVDVDTLTVEAIVWKDKKDKK